MIFFWDTFSWNYKPVVIIQVTMVMVMVMALAMMA